jgi:heat-inducible transcriptional repressor
VQLKEAEKTILKTVVVHYLQNPEPIGSVQLKDVATLPHSSATIRNHFRRLVEEGLLEQLHASSGRIPTLRALKHHWREQLSPEEPVTLESVDRVAQSALHFELFVLLQPAWQNRLESVQAIGSQMLAARFEEGVATVPASAIVGKLLEEFIGYDLADLQLIAQNNRIDVLTAALTRLRASQTLRFNAQALIEAAAAEPVWSAGFFEPFYDGSVAAGQKPGLFFEPLAPGGQMVILQEALLEKRPIRLVTFGPITRDYSRFMNYLSKEGR